MRRSLAILTLSLLSGCTIPQTVENLDRESPPPELGRSSWVRYSARTGSWIGALAGGVVSIVLLPVTYPISLLYEEPLGYAKTEFLWMGVSGGASIGHFALGAPTDFVDYAFHRAWVDTPSPTDYEFTPLKPPVGPGSGDRAASPEDSGTKDSGTKDSDTKDSGTKDSDTKDSGSQDGSSKKS